MFYSLCRVSNKFTLYKNETLEYPNSHLFGPDKIRPNFCINKLAPSVGPEPRITLKIMSAMAITTPIVTTVTKPATNPRDADATPGLTSKNSVKNIMRTSNQSLWTRPGRTNFRGHPHGRSPSPRLDASNEGYPEDRERFRSIEESYGDSHSHSYHDKDRSRHMKRRRDNESPTRMPNNVNTYDGTGDPEDHVKIFQAAALVERRAMPTWCHMFNSTLIGAARVWFDELPSESIDSYKDLKAAFLAYFMQQKKYVKGLVEIHNIKQKDVETIEDFMKRLKVETGHMKGDPKSSNRRDVICERHTELCSLLKENLDIFAWQPSDMTGVPRSIVEHRLNMWDGYSPVQQKKTGRAPERAKAIQAEVQKLVEAGIMREVYYHDWLSNPVMIQLAESDEEKTAFHTGQGMYCYTKMPFGLKNAGVTYQRLVDKAFDIQIGRNKEVYVDDLVIKSHTEAEMLRDIGETFRTLQKINMKLNPKKCMFEAVEGVFLGYMVTPEGIRPFFSKSAEKFLPLFKTLKNCIKKSDFHWTLEAEQAFKQLQQHLSELPMLVAPKPKEELIVYLSTLYGAISAVLMTKREAVQTPVYFVSRALQGPELNYTPMEKLVMSLVFAAKRLQRHFQAYPIAVITDQPIKQIMSRPDVAGRLQKWSIMLGEHNITYRPRTSVKRQVLGDFLAKVPDESPLTASVLETQQVQWKLFTDGSSSSNNEAEYEALIAGLRIAVQMGVQNVHVNVDSKLVANQVLGTYVAKEENMIKYLEKVKSLVLVEILKEKSIQEKEVTTVVEEDGPTWMIPITEYLKEGTLPNDKKEARKLRIKARHNDASYAMDGGKLGPKWKGPYDETEALRDGAYKLRFMDGTILPRT
nr:reverse transcriptase domain-containing protein [Tanacetum cinerariifolium]